MLVSRNVSMAPQKITVADSTFGSIDLLVRRPTFAELAAAHAVYGRTKEYIEAAIVIVVGWEGVVTDEEQPKPVLFTAKAFEAECVANPWLLVRTMQALDDIYFPAKRAADLGNSNSPSIGAADTQPSADGTP